MQAGRTTGRIARDGVWSSRRGGKALAMCGLLSFAVIGAGGGPASAAPVNRPVAVPFIGGVSGTVTATGAGTFALDGAGVDSAQGVVKYHGDVVVTSAPGAVPLVDTLAETLTSSNGDTLTIHCDQVATPIGTTGVLQGTDHWTIVGGTGRFAHESGSGTGVTYVANLQSFSKAFTGTVSLG